MYAAWFYFAFDGAIQCNHINISRYLYCISHNTIKFGLGWVESKNMDHVHLWLACITTGLRRGAGGRCADGKSKRLPTFWVVRLRDRRAWSESGTAAVLSGKCDVHKHNR